MENDKNHGKCQKSRKKPKSLKMPMPIITKNAENYKKRPKITETAKNHKKAKNRGKCR